MSRMICYCVDCMPGLDTHIYYVCRFDVSRPPKIGACKGPFLVCRYDDLLSVCQALKEKGYTTYKMRQNNIIGQRTISDYKHNNVVGSVKNISLLCKLLDMQPGELLEYIPDDNGT